MRLLKTYFYLYMSLLIAVIVIYGFSHTLDRNLIHPAVKRPLILYIHVAVFSAWLVFFILQSALIRVRNVKLHRQLGWFGVAVAVAIPMLGVSTAITMGRFRMMHFHATNVKSDLIVQFFDMISFTVLFSLAIYWRKQPEFHRRLILVASCALTSAAFGRFPPEILPSSLFYIGVDLLIFVGATRDLICEERIHQVYLYSLPILLLGQTITMYISTHAPPFWLRIADAIL